MKKILTYILLAVSMTGQGQELPVVNNYSEISNNYKGELGTGNFVFNAPLFEMETVHPAFAISGSLHYNAQAAATVFTAPGVFNRRGFAFDFVPTIYRNLQKTNLWDEVYYKVNSADLPSGQRPQRDNDLFEFEVFGLRGSFRLVYNENNTIDVKLIDGSGYAEVTPHYTMSSGSGDAKIIDLNGFTVTDRSGFSFRFNEVEESAVYNKGGSSHFFDNPNGFNYYKKSFLLSGITDEHERTLVSYTYTSYLNALTDGSHTFTYQQKVIDEIDVRHRARLDFETDKSEIKSIQIKNYFNQQIRRIVLSANSISLRNSNDDEEERYQFHYNAPGLSSQPVTNYGNYVKNQDCPGYPLQYSSASHNYDAGLLRTIVLPRKGRIEIEYESNTVPLGGLEKYNEQNYDYVEVPVTRNDVNKTYSFTHEDVDLSSGEAFYIKYSSQFYTDPLILDPDGNPVAYYPHIQIKLNNTFGSFVQSFGYEDQCDYGESVNLRGFNGLIIIFPRQGFDSHISNVKVYKRTLKPESEWKKYIFGPSVRVKKITSIDRDNTVVREQLYSYNFPDDPGRSSGMTFGPMAAVTGRPFYNVSYMPFPIFYRYVAVEETGKGKTVYELNSDRYVNSESAAAEVAFQPKNIWKYDDNGNLKEHISNSFEDFKVSSDSEAKHRIKKVVSVIKTYEGTQFSVLNTEKVFDTVSMHLIRSMVTDTVSGDVFEEAFTYEKLGSAYYQTAVEKTKNNAALNRSVFTYQQQSGAPAYNLAKTEAAKENRPLETQREITLYDDYGNVLEYKTKDGMVVSQIWGYSDSKLAAELKNVPYSSISTAAVAGIKASSDAAAFNETALLGLLDGLRTAHGDGFITTYTYTPQGSISRVTDANGRKESYEYDSYNRLWRVLNHEGLVVKEYEYNTRNY